jgi:hypothetical protein
MANVKLTKPTVPLSVVANGEVDGVEMGVLSDGTPFLGARGLARVCGVAPSAIIQFANDWSADSTKPRDQKIATILATHGVKVDRLFIPLSHQGKPLSAFPEAVCVAIIQYYAFELQREAAQTALYTLARRSLREFIYSALGYDPGNKVPAQWKQLNDRMILNTAPRGYFSVFKEISDLMISAIQFGMNVDSHTLPDGSVGLAWAKHWNEQNLGAKFGERIRHPHVFPEYWPQAAAEIECWVYPLPVLGEFKVWLQEIYLPEKYPKYIDRKVKDGAIEASRATLLLSAFRAGQDPDDET